MSFCYTFVSFENGLIAPVQIYNMPPEIYQNTPLFLLNAPPSHSQLEEKQNFILQASAATGDSLSPQPQEKAKVVKKKRLQKKVRDENFGWRNQNKDRNIMSNILKAFVNYAVHQPNSRPIIERTTQRLGIENGVSSLASFIEANFPPAKSYISPKHVRQLLRDGPDSHLRLALRLVLGEFLRLNFPLLLLKSTKIKRRSQVEQMKKARELFELLFRQ